MDIVTPDLKGYKRAGLALIFAKIEEDTRPTGNVTSELGCENSIRLGQFCFEQCRALLKVG